MVGVKYAVAVWLDVVILYCVVAECSYVRLPRVGVI